MDLDKKLGDSTADSSINVEDLDHNAVHGFKDKRLLHVISHWTDLEKHMEKRLEFLYPLELLVNRIGLRFFVAATDLIGQKERVLVKKREIGSDKSVETPSLAGTGMAVREIGEVEREATNLLKGSDFAAEDTVDEH